jgi:transposase-like protein
MARASYKKPAAPAFQILVPKRGKARTVRKVTAMRKQKTSLVKYVRSGQPSMKSRGDRGICTLTLPELFDMTEEQIIDKLLKVEWLENKAGATCPVCKVGNLGKLQKFKGRGKRYKCGRKCCRKYVSPQHGHPIFKVSKHTGALKHQLAAVLCNLAGVSHASTHKLLGQNHKVMEEVSSRLARARQRYIVKKQNTITFGNGRTWRDAEADEVTLAKYTDPELPDDECTSWEQWAGLVERGRPESLVLNRSPEYRTCQRAPGPGAIRKVDWKPVAKQYLENRKIILHTDRAKAYQMKVDGMLHDSVRHSKKRVKVRGKWVWKNPVYSKVVTHKLPGGGTIKVKSGSQIIDRAWRFIREHLRGFSKRPGSSTFATRVRSAQWLYWHRNKDLVAATGELLKDLKYR